MASIKKADERKWINSGVMIASVAAGFICLSFVEQMGEWFDLESKIPRYTWVVQGLAVIAGLGTFLGITRYQKSAEFLRETYTELTKVVFPDKSDTVRQCIGIMIGLIIVGFILGALDFVISQILSLIH